MFDLGRGVILLWAFMQIKYTCKCIFLEVIDFIYENEQNKTYKYPHANDFFINSQQTAHILFK